MLVKIVAISFVVSVIVHALKGAMDTLSGKYASLKKLDQIVDTVSAVEDKLDAFLQNAAGPSASEAPKA